jgi:hypothetical protein
VYRKLFNGLSINVGSGQLVSPGVK